MLSVTKLLILLVFPQICSAFFWVSAAEISNLAYKPELVTKQSILEHHQDKTRLHAFAGIPTLAYVTPWNPRGFKLARETADRLTHVSPVWINVKPVYDQKGDIIDVNIEGEDQIIKSFLADLKKRNENIKIVPRFKFDAKHFQPHQALQMMQKDALIHQISIKMVKFCKKHKFEGILLEILDAVFSGSDKTSKEIALESMGAMGDTFRKYGLHTVFSMPPPIPYKEESSDYWYRDGLISEPQCLELLNHFDHIQLWTYSDQANTDRDDIKVWVDANLKKFGFSNKMMIGINFYGTEFKYDAEKRENAEFTTVVGKRYLEVIKHPDSVLEFNKNTVEHILRFNGSVIFYPSMTSLEYRISQAYEREVGIAIWDYGQGLDYFTNLI